MRFPPRGPLRSGLLCFTPGTSAVLHFALACAALVGLAGLPTRAAADELHQFWMVDDVCAGWENGDPEVRTAWHAIGHNLVGYPTDVPLVSGWTLGQGKLQFAFHLERDSTLEIALLPATSDVVATPQAVRLTSRGPCGFVDEQGEVHAGVRLPADRSRDPLASFVAVELQAEAGRLSLSVDQQSAGSCEIDPSARYAVALRVVRGKVEVGNFSLSEDAGEPLLPETGLEGWSSPAGPDGWERDGQDLVCLNKDGNYLRSEEQFGNFVLSFEYHLATGGNSGLGIRTPPGGWPSGDGMELQLIDEPADAPLTRHSQFALYGNLEPLARGDHGDEWNRAIVRAEGPWIHGWVNETLVQSVNVGRLPELQHRHLRGWLGFQDHGARIVFRNLRIVRLPDELDRPEWHAPAVRAVSELALEPLLNPELLAQSTSAERLQSRSAYSQPQGADSALLFDLPGPGAVVQLTRPPADGRVRIFLNDAAEPAVDCPVGELQAHVPWLTEEATPLLTYLPFDTRFRLDWTPADVAPTNAAPWRIDWLAPRELPAEDQPWVTFAGPEHSTARGLLPPITYRCQQLAWGVQRELDASERPLAAVEELAPGDAREVLALDGPHVVHWWRLLADLAVLQDDGLWLRVYVDGASEPAVDAPVRWLLPGLADGANYPNFACTIREGFTSLLPLCCARSLRCELVNEGPRPLSVGFAASVAALPADQVSPVQLRARFLQPGDAFAGPGRLVGLVVPAADTTLDAPCDLTLDGDPLAGERTCREMLGLLSDEPTEKHAIGGRVQGLAWRTFWLDPRDFSQRLERTASGPDRVLVLAYVAAP